MWLACPSIKYRPQSHIRKYKSMPVFLDLLDLDYQTNLYATGIQAAIYSNNSQAKDFIVGTKYPWLFENSPYVKTIVDNRNEVLNKYKYIKHYAMNPHKSYDVLTESSHISYAWVRALGFNNFKNPMPTYFINYEHSDDIMISLSNKEVENELLKRPNFYKIRKPYSRKGFVDVLKAKAVICDDLSDSSWAYLANSRALVFWHAYNYRKYGFNTHLNYHVNNCKTPLCNRPLLGRKDLFKCPYDFACKDQKGLLNIIEGSLDELLSMPIKKNKIFEEEENEKEQSDIFNWI